MAKDKSKPVQHEELVESGHQQEAPDVENESQDHDAEVPASANGHNVDKNNKASLVRAALAEGYTKPSEGCRWIKEHYDVEVGTTYYSVAKSQQAKRSGDVPTPRLTSAAAAHLHAPASSSPVGVPIGFGGDVKAIRGLLTSHANEADAVKDLIATVDTLVSKYGVSGLNEMIDAFSE